MLLSKRNKLIASGPIAMVLALTTFAMDNDLADFLEFVVTLQLMATVALLFGLLKKDTQHKDKFLFFWLAITSILFFGYCYFNINFMTHDVFYAFYNFFEGLLAFVLFLLLLIPTAVLAYLMYTVYQEFVELRNSHAGSNSPPLTPDVDNVVVETKDAPPSYASSNNLTVSIQN